MNEILQEMENEGVNPRDVYYWEQKQCRARFGLKLSPARDELNQAVIGANSESDPAVAAAKNKLQQLQKEATEASMQEMNEALDKLMEALRSEQWQPWAPDGYEWSPDHGELRPVAD